MPKLPFAFIRETERAAIERAIRDPAKRQLCYDMVDAVLRVRETARVTEAELAPIIEGLAASSEAVWDRARGWLAKLHGFDPSLSTAIERLANDPRATVRWHLCAGLKKFPRELSTRLLRQFLSDRGAKIRGTAVTATIAGNHYELLPDLNTLLANEANPERQEDLKEAIALLEKHSHVRDGMEVRRIKDGIDYVIRGPEEPK
jgi:hypothetical protein